MREAWIDRLKGLLIALVVLGHAVGSFAVTATPEARPLFSYLYRVIYFFHMPAFFLVAGMLWHRSDLSFGAFALKKMKRLLVPFWCVGLLSIPIYFLFSGVVSSNAEYWVRAVAGETWWSPFFAVVTWSAYPGTEGFRFNSVLWFLPCLFVVQCAGWGLDRICSTNRGRLLVAVGLLIGRYCLGRLCISWYPFQLNTVIQYLPYFILGRVAAPFLLRLSLSGVCTVGLVALYLMLVKAVPFDGWRLSAECRLVAHFAMALGGFLVALAVAKKMSWRGWVSLGGCSLGIMLVHKFPLLFLQMISCKFVSAHLQGVVGESVSCALVFCLSLAVAWWGVGIARRLTPWIVGERKEV